MAETDCVELKQRAAMLRQEADLGRRRAEDHGQEWDNYQDQLSIADRFDVMAAKVEAAIAENCDTVAEQPQSSQIFDVPSSLRQRVGPRNKQAETKALAQAEIALSELSANFDAWMEDDLSKLYCARDAMLLLGVDDVTTDQLFTPALDLKGLGTTYNFPLVTRLAASLCKLLGNSDKPTRGTLPLVDAHVCAIRASVREGARSDDNPTGAALAGELERHTSNYMSG